MSRDRVFQPRDDQGRFAPRYVPKRDDQGRFAPRYVPKRDDQGRFAAKKVPRRAPPPPKKVPRRASPPPKKAPWRAPLPQRKAPRRAPSSLKKAPRRAPPPPAKKVSRRKPPLPTKKIPRRVPTPSKKAPKRAPKRAPPPAKKIPRRAKRPAKKLPRKKISRIPRKRRRREVVLSKRSLAAEAAILDKLYWLMEMVLVEIPEAGTAVKAFVNTDGSVDGELRVQDLPDELREEENLSYIISWLSEVFRAFRPFPEVPAMRGRFWVSFGMRFGPQNETEVGQLAEMYKRFKGLYQVGTYPAAAWHPTPIQMALAPGLKTIMEGVARKQGFSPTVLLIRFTWTPDGKRPGHWKGEGGSSTK